MGAGGIWAARRCQQHRLDAWVQVGGVSGDAAGAAVPAGLQGGWRFRQPSGGDGVTGEGAPGGASTDALPESFAPTVPPIGDMRGDVRYKGALGCIRAALAILCWALWPLPHWPRPPHPHLSGHPPSWLAWRIPPDVLTHILTLALCSHPFPWLYLSTAALPLPPPLAHLLLDTHVHGRKYHLCAHVSRLFMMVSHFHLASQACV